MAVGISPQYLVQIENGKRPIPPNAVRALERLFSVDPKSLRPDIFGDPEPVHTDEDAA